MKKLVYLFAMVIVFAACNNDSDKKSGTPGDSLNELPDTSRSGDTLYKPDTPGKYNDTFHH